MLNVYENTSEGGSKRAA